MGNAAPPAGHSKAALVGIVLVVVGVAFLWAFFQLKEPLLVSGAVGFGASGIGLLLSSVLPD
jgi:hypothetical protein